VLCSARQLSPFNRNPESLLSPALPLSYPRLETAKKREGPELNRHQRDKERDLDLAISTIPESGVIA
jgi:hypothetical protein